MQLNNFLAYTIFFPKIFFFAVEQRLKYWVKYLSFFICQPEFEVQLFQPQTEFFYTARPLITTMPIFSFYFSVKKQFFYFLLLKFFFKAVSIKNLAKKKTDFLAGGDVPGISSGSRAHLFSENAAGGVVQQNKKNSSAFLSSQGGHQGFELKISRTLFFVTTTAQAWFMKNFFYKAENLLILFTPDLITNRRFFYKMLFGFHQERKNVSFPRQAYKKARFSSILFSGWASTIFFWDAFLFKKIRKEALGFFSLFAVKFQNYTAIFSGTCFLEKVLKLFKKNNFLSRSSEEVSRRREWQPAHDYYCGITNFFLKDGATSFILFIAQFFLIHWLKLYATSAAAGGGGAAYFWRKIALFTAPGAFSGSAVTSYKSPNFLKFFKNFYSVVLQQLSNSLLTYSFLFSQQLFFSRHIFDKHASLIKNPKAVAEKQNLINKVMLLKFLPINLIVLFAAATNKQLLRDVFRFRLPIILISAMDHQKLPSDYAYPGNSFEFNVLYFYSKFLLELATAEK